MADSDYLSVTRRGASTIITLTRPKVHNAFDARLIAELKAAFDALRDDSETRVVVLAAEGPSFSAGADLNWMRRAASFTENENLRDAGALAAMLRSMAECPRPVIARVQGPALGGGVGLVAAADIAIAAETARFAFTEVRLGLIPATIAPHVVEKIGPGRARALFLSAERFDARQAEAIGLVQRVVPVDELDAAVDSVVDTLLAGGPLAHRMVKELVRLVQTETGAELDRATSALVARARVTEEGREGIRAFLEKRLPSWRRSGAE